MRVLPLLLLLASAAVSAACRTTAGPQSVPLAAPPRSVTSEPGALERAVDAARVVCVGEAHDQRPHHEFQRDVLARMAARPGPLLLGMEMFQRPAQPHLDDYVAGRIDEVEMLRRTEYFTRWSFDHTLYAPLWRFARAHGVRVVALNADVHVTRKIGREGIAALTPEERGAIAADLDLDVPSHRERIMGVFGDTSAPSAHGPADPTRRERMYHVMCVWDETMAESAALALQKAGPGSRMLIVAGIGHVGGFDGIPDRLARRVPGLEPIVIACRTGEGELEFLDADLPPWRLAHFVVRTEADERGDAPRLGAQFQEGSMTIAAVVPGGNAARIGLEKGDVVEAIAGPDGALAPLRDVTDLRVALDRAWLHGGRGCAVRYRRADGSVVTKSFDLDKPASS